VDGKEDPRRAGAAYAAVFAKHGFEILTGQESDLARRMAASPVKEQLVAALEDWATGATDQHQSRLLALAQQADRDPDRNQLRDPRVWRDLRQLTRLAGQAKVERLSPALLVAVGFRLDQLGGPGLELLQRGQRRYPGDFWLNFKLANALKEDRRGRWDEAISYYRAALAVRPQTAAVYNNLGLALAAKPDLDAAIAAYRQALAIDDKDALALNNLGLALADKQDLPGAIAAYKRALALDSKLAAAHNNLGAALFAQRDLPGAFAAFHKALELEPGLALAHYNLGVALRFKGDLDRAIAAYRKSIALNPRDAKTQTNYGNALADKGNLPGAIAAYEKALAINPNQAQTLGALGQALRRQGRFAEARTATRRALDLLPSGHSLRDFLTRQLRQCEFWLALDTKFPAIERGDIQPADANEQLALAVLCQQYKLRYAAAARYFAAAYTANARLAHDLTRQRRYTAACAAALAAAGQGKDAAQLDDKGRARFRRLALAWLQADLAAWTQVAARDSASARAAVRGTLEHWQKDSDLAGVRETDALAHLSEAEQKAWRQLWADVAALRKRVQAK
jgi:tetratricopeptide (TPR) repeat protein